MVGYMRALYLFRDANHRGEVLDFQSKGLS
jgi:hypothetical protein